MRMREKSINRYAELDGIIPTPEKPLQPGSREERVMSEKDLVKRIDALERRVEGL